jgi:signal transduction histidine kinase
MRLSRFQLWAVAATAALVGAAFVPLVATNDLLPDRGLWIALDLVIGWSFAGVGLYAWYRRPDNAVGVLMVATAFAWYVAMLEKTDVPLFFTIGSLLSNLFVAVAIQLLLGFPSGRLETASDRALVVTTYLTVTLGFLPLMLVLDLDALGCADCPDNLLLIHGNESLANTWSDVLSVSGVVLLLVVLVRLAQRWRRAGGPLRATVTPVFVAGGALLLILAVMLALTLVATPHGVMETLYYSALVPFALVPFVFLAGLVKGRILRGQGLGAFVRRLGAGLGRGELHAALAQALGDPSVEIAYWLPESGDYVDARGRPVRVPEPDSGRAVTEVSREGRHIAAIVHDPALLDDREHVREVGAAAALALENERLEAELRAKVVEVRASRARLVEVGLRNRRQLERDLHDGAQQRLVSLALGLRLAHERLDSDPRDTDRLLQRSRAELDEALKELRELARGIHPAILSDRGLAAAVEALAHRAPLPVEVRELPADRLPDHVELATYFVVAEALTNVAKYASARQASVEVVRRNGLVTVAVSDDGVGGADMDRGTGLRGLSDRLAALEGRLDVDSEPGLGTTVRASMPVS